MLIVVDDGEIDQEAKDACPQEVPERGGHQEIHGPAVGKLFTFLADGPVFHQTARDQTQQRHRFHGREHGSHPEPERGCAIPEIVMGGSQDSAQEHEGGGEVHHH